MKRRALAVISLIASMSHFAHAETWYDKKLEGWYYFEKGDAKRQTQEKAPKPDVDFSEIDSPEVAEKVLQSEKKKLQQKLALALLSAKPEHVEAYMKAQSLWIKRSELFAVQWGQSLLQRPDLSTSLEVPTTSYGIQAKKAFEEKRRKMLCQKLGKDHFLILFFKGSDPYAYGAYKTARGFASLHGWQLRAVSLDGKGFQHGAEARPNYEVDKGLGRHLSVEASPVFFIVKPGDSLESTQAHPVGLGLISVSDLEKNIEIQLGDNHEI